jgi:hypothetical protein
MYIASAQFFPFSLLGGTKHIIQKSGKISARESLISITTTTLQVTSDKSEIKKQIR